MINLQTAWISFIITADIYMAYKMITSYGKSKYMRGKLDGFKECADIQNEVFNKIKEEHNARSKTKAEVKS